MDESFELLSSMSPKLNGRQKTVKKAIKILALKRPLRRSSIYDKALGIVNEDLAILKAGRRSKSSKHKSGKTNKDNTIIIDSTDSEDNEDVPIPKLDKLSSEVLRNCDKIEAKVDRVQEWINNIQMAGKKDNLSFFSQVSTVYGDETSKFDPDSNELAACSTFNENMVRRFDELFVTEKNGPKGKINTSFKQEQSKKEAHMSDTSKHNESFETIEDSKEETNELKGSNDFRNVLIDETLMTSDESAVVVESADSFKDLKLFPNKKAEGPLLDESFSIEINTSLRSKLKETSEENANDFKNVLIDETILTSDESGVKLSESLKSRKLSPNRTPERPPPTQGDNVTIRRRNVKLDSIGQTPKNIPFDKPEEAETLLDILYGMKWRDKHNHILPLSESKKKPASKNLKKIVAPNTDRIIKPSNRENIPKNLNADTKKLNFNKLKTPIASPWMERLKTIVDSDSDSTAETTNDKPKGLENVKTRLSFCDNTPLTKTVNGKNSNRECDINKVSFDESSGDEKTQKGTGNNLKLRLKTKRDKNKKTNMNKGGNKENNPNNENKENQEHKNKPVLLNYKKTSTHFNKNILKSKTESRKKSETTNSSDSCSEIEISSDEEYDQEVTRLWDLKRKSIRPSKEDSYSFLESLSTQIPLDKCDMRARIFRTGYKRNRDELTKFLFALYNEKVFENAIPSDTELEWNEKLRNTAGLCYCKKITHRDGRVVRNVRIGLSSKVLDSPDRLRDTLIHEMCHAGTWIINEISNGHGLHWKNWAFKAMKVFPELPPIKRCHTYQINTKYTYKCTGCGYSIGRHSKSLDTERKRCGRCRGKFEVLLNKTNKNGETRSVPVTPRAKASAFSLFVKDNYARYKEPSRKHGDVMKLLGVKFSELKVKNGD